MADVLDPDVFNNRGTHVLTRGQRLQLEVNGYVIIENALTADETGRYYEAMKRLEKDFKDSDDPGEAMIRNCKLSQYTPHKWHFTHILESQPEFLEYLSHPLMVSLAEELVGGSVRLEESEATINRRPPDLPDFPAGFHYGTRPNYGCYTEKGLHHCMFVKCLTNLTELGPDDGGTVVIAGSHKLNLPIDEVIDAARQEPSLVHQIIAPAGSTVLFGESLVHATGILRSDNERVIIIGGYTPTMYQAWIGNEPSKDYVEQSPDHLKTFLSGDAIWNWARNARDF